RYDLEAQYIPYDKPREKIPAMHSRLLRSAALVGIGVDLIFSLSHHKANAELSDAGRTAYVYQSHDPRRVYRAYVTNGAIVRHEDWYDGILRSYVEIKAPEVDRPLADSDLSHPVPLLTRYSWSNNPVVFISGLFAVIAAAGLAFWAWIFASAEDREKV